MRCVLTDDSGKWFDDAKAVCFKENTRWDGHNHISEATGSQWYHEWLYYSKSGNWILHSHSNYQHERETYSVISEESAVAWLISQGHPWDGNEQFEQLPESVRQSVEAAIESAEL